MEGSLDTQTIVYDTLCERKVLGTVLSMGALYDKLAESVTEDCFYSSKHKEIWKTMADIRNEGGTIDLISVVAELKKGGSRIQPVEVAGILDDAGFASEIDFYAVRLRELNMRRRLWVLGQKLITAGVSEVDDIEQVQQLVNDEMHGLYDRPEGVYTLTDALLKLSDIITKNMTKGSALTGTPTGFHRLDAKGGLQGSDLIIIAGETSQGKSSLALSMVKYAIEKGAKVAMYSMEMTKEQLASRIVAMQTGIPSNTIMYNGDIQPYELEMIDGAKSQIPGDNLIFDERSTSSIETILLSIRNMKLKYDISGAVVDYLQILNVNSKNNGYTREQAMGDASRRLKNLAKELDIWIVALSQLSRNTQDPIPSLSRLRDSGQIAEAADVVILIYRPEVYGRMFPSPFESLPENEIKGKAMIDVAKGRNIGIFKFLVKFDANTTRFSDLEDQEGDEPDFPDYPIEANAPF